MNGKLGKALTYAAVIIALIVVTILGVKLPAPDMDIGAQAARVADFIIPTTNPTATPGVVIDNRSGGSVSLQLRSQLTPVADFNRNGSAVLANGLTLTAGGLTITAGGATITSGGLDMTNDPITNIGAAGTDFGTDGQLTTAKGFTATAGGLLVTAGGAEFTGDVDVNNELVVDQGLTVATSGITITAGLFRPGFADETITNGEFFTPTAMVHALDSAGNVTFTLGASATNGQIVIFIGDDANTITIADTNIRTSDGNAATLGQFDVIAFVYQDSEWHQIVKTANS